MEPVTRYVDLHLHTNHSDGADEPARVIERAASLGLAAVAVTDHDATSGLAAARDAAATHGIEFLDGVEISAGFGNREIHILGLGIRPESEILQEALEEFLQNRAQRAHEIIARLNELGVPLEKSAIEAHTAQGAIGRMHIARELFERGHTRTVQGAFDKYIGAGRPAYIPKTRMPCPDAIDLIHQAHGLAFIAHPGLGDAPKTLDKLLTLPFDGLEAYHPRHSPGHTTQFTQLAQERNLLITGGSDCHGAIKNHPPLIGSVQVPYAHYARIKTALAAP